MADAILNVDKTIRQVYVPRWSKGKKKKGPPLSEEEKALQAEEHRKKLIRDRRAVIKQAMIEEEKRSKLSMVEMHKTWRNIMREASVLEMRGDMKWMAQKHVHEVECKDRHIHNLCKTIEESENQHKEAMNRHFIMMDNMISNHDMQMQTMEENFQEQLQNLTNSFFGERERMTQNHSDQKKGVATMVKNMKEFFDEEIDEKRQEFEAHLDEVKSKNKEDFNVLKIMDEAKIEHMERDIENTHHDYIDKTKGKEEEFKMLTKKDRITARIIEKRMRELIAHHNQMAQLKRSLIIKGKEWDDSNKYIFDEKWRLNGHFIKLKRYLGKTADIGHENLKRTSMSVYEATQALNKILDFVRKLQTLVRLNGKLETEHEQIFPFNPLYVSSIPTAPLQILDAEVAKAAEKDKCYMHGNQPKAVWEVADDTVRGEPVPGHVVPKQEQRFQVDMKISFPTDGPDEGLPPVKTVTYRWSTYAIDDNGNDIAELDYLQNFQRHYNKVMLDNLALQLERRKLIAENKKLQSIMAKWLDSYTFTDKAKSKPNSLMDVDRILMFPPSPKKSTIVNIPKKKLPPKDERLLVSAGDT